MASAELLDRARAIEAVCARFGITLRAAATQFPLRHPAIVSVLVGARSPEEVDDAVTSFATPIPPELWQALKADGLIR